MAAAASQGHQIEDIEWGLTATDICLQVAAQLHALLQEKAMLASENERLLRENCGLQVHTIFARIAALFQHYLNLPP